MIDALLIIVVLAVVLGFLIWRTAHPYRVSPEEMADALQRVLDGKMPSERWHQFVHRRISRHPYLDSLRMRLVVLPLKTRQDGDGKLYGPDECVRIAAVLAELRRKNA